MQRGELPRHALWTRVVHWTIVVSFAALLVTGLPLNAPSLYALTDLVGGGYAARATHPWVGLLFSAALLALVVGWARPMLPEAGDAAWARSVGRYLAHARDVPETGRFNPAQKVFFWAAALGGLGLLASGVVLWQPGWFPRAVVPWAAPLHVLAFALLTGAVIQHAYLSTLAFPGTLRAMLVGTVSRAWGYTHHRRWARDIDRGTGPSND